MTETDSTSLFPLDSAETYLRPNRPDLERHGNALRWSDNDGVTELRVETLDYHTHDGMAVTERVTVTHTAAWMSRVTPEDAMAMNKWATLSALVPAGLYAPACLTCKVDIFSTDRKAAERVYAPLICTEAAIIGWHAARIARRQLRIDPEASPLLHTGERPPFDAEAFAAACASSEQLGLVASKSEGYVCAEFPWDPGARSRQFAIPKVRAELLAAGECTADDLDPMAGATSLLRLTVNEPHALYGSGVLSRLEIPVDTNDDTASALINELNRWEVSGSDLPPLFGAWCMGPRAPTFVTFIPNQFCVPGLLQNLLHWHLVRHSRVRDWLTTSKAQN